MGLYKGPKGLTDEFYAFKKSSKLSIVGIELIPIKDNVFTAVKRDAKFQKMYVEGVPYS